MKKGDVGRKKEKFDILDIVFVTNINRKPFFKDLALNFTSFQVILQTIERKLFIGSFQNIIMA